MSKIKNGGFGLDQYGAEPFEEQQFGTAGVEGVNHSAPCASFLLICVYMYWLLSIKLAEFNK